MQAFGLLAIDCDHVLRIVRRERCVQLGQVLARSGLLDDSSRRTCQFLQWMCGLVLHLELESTKLPQSLDRRRQRRKYNCPLHPKQHRAHTVHDRRGRMLFPLTLRIWLQRDENQPLVRCCSREGDLHETGIDAESLPDHEIHRELQPPRDAGQEGDGREAPRRLEAGEAFEEGQAQGSGPGADAFR